MKRIVTILFGALLMSIVAAPAMAQIQITIPGFRSDNPWFNNVPQAQTFKQFLADHPDDARELAQNPGLLYDPEWRGQHRQLQYFLQTHPDVWDGLKAQSADIYDPRFSQFLGNHREVASDLRDNPELLYDPGYRSHHPELTEFLADHPQVWENMNAERESAGRTPAGFGAYDNQHRWHDANWWHQNNPGWFWESHPEWASVNPQWRDQDGTYDQQHVWHYGSSQAAMREQANQQTLDDQQRQQSIDDQQQHEHDWQGRGDNNE
jgi:hypothetical protein